MMPAWYANMRWLLQDGVYPHEESYLDVLRMMSAPINRWLDATKESRDQTILIETHRVYFAFCDWSHLWSESARFQHLAPILQVSKRLAGLMVDFPKDSVYGMGHS